MGIFKELGTNVVDGVLSGASGPLGSLFGDKHAYTSASFPSDVEGVGQRHFIRFNITTIKGAAFDVAGKNTEQAQQSASGEFLGGLAGAAAGGGLLGGLAGTAATNLLEQTGIGTALDTGIQSAKDNLTSGLDELAEDFAGGISGLVPDSVESTFGKLAESAGSIKEATVDKVPITKDILEGIGSFAGSIGGLA